MVLSTAVLSVLMMAIPLDSSDLIVTLSTFSTILSRYCMLLDVDSVFRTFILLFILQTAMLSGFILYCDCPWTTYLDTKILLFYLMVCNIALATTYLHQLLCYELIGLLSFRLIGHYMDRINATRGSHIAVGTNRIADVFLAIIFIKSTTAVALSWTTDPLLLDLILLSLAVKSISVISYMWLPDAMEGPTPVSALLHSATLVIAGIIVFTRSSGSYQLTTLSAILISGTLLVLVSYVHDTDTKKCAAISTCIMLSLLWVEVIASSTGAWSLAIAHANYKSTLFVLLAYVLTASGTQDLRGYVWSVSSVANVAILCVLVYSISLAGTHYAYSKLGTKIMIHGSGSLVRYSTAIMLLITTLSLYVLWASFFIVTVSNDSICTTNSVPPYVMAWVLIIVGSLSSNLLPISIASTSIWSSSMLTLLALSYVVIWIGRNSISWSFMITSVHFVSASRSLHAATTHFVWLIPFTTISRTSFRSSLLLLTVFLCLA